ncbi:hypothetical protein [Streptomyces mirabilis]|uniref:hypothetical protein n=1 Tax=Streptomyces mirabilis TaxID=68239 RepID=UPI0036D8BBC8
MAVVGRLSAREGRRNDGDGQDQGGDVLTDGLVEESQGQREHDRAGVGEQEVRGDQIRPAPRVGEPLGAPDTAAEGQADACTRQERSGSERRQ